MLRIRIGYPSADDEKAVILAQRTEHPIETLEPVLTGADLERLQKAVREVRLDESVLDYVLTLVRKTRTNKHLTVGVSPRGSVALSRAAQAHAFLARAGLRAPRRREGARGLRAGAPRARARCWTPRGAWTSASA